MFVRKAAQQSSVGHMKKLQGARNYVLVGRPRFALRLVLANDTYEALCLARSAEEVARKGSHRDLESRSDDCCDRRGVR